ncbi:hypothetical protein COT97_04290 [Candidatus Falkowbacteria bacterium CG10_big_fil_rev_8_21_14_0_10_39_11]|uniref:DUF5667 domain-containing protein n=1 Tax=Candidatus Falkowbacteria bacterium CG10_big_fil_rev_8_21_14_0_10_39_11 TaxID=1974565 RepID=A0A2H0V4D2_9BACT|nr:MAG: hypothetical protein COT97_04290 [Candidatus Falkowbacteria bacterium CG10_big_fil_rev_8_21_14_0_10_39_11]
MDKIIKQLKDLKGVKPREDWTKANRDVLLAQISSQGSARKSSFFDGWNLIRMMVPISFINFLAKPIGIVTVAVLFVFGSGAFTVNASKSSIPGDILYPVKLTSEKVQVGLTVSEDRKAELHVDFAEERVSEIEQIAANETDPVKRREQISVATDNFKKNMDNIQETLEKVKTVKAEKDVVNRSIEVVKQVDLKVEAIASRLDNNNDLKGDLAVVKNIDAAQAEIEETQAKAVEVIVDKYDKGEAELSSEEMLETVEAQIKKVGDRITEVAEREKSVVDTSGQAEVDKVAPTDSEKTVETTDVTVKTEVAGSESAQRLLDEASSLLNQGDLINALEKLRESSAIAREYKDIIDSKIEELIPVDESNLEAARVNTSAPVVPAVLPEDNSVDTDDAIEL